MTLRELGWMAHARQKAEWLRAGIMAAASKSAFGGEFKPLSFIPPSLRPEPELPREKTPEEMEVESKLAWRCLNRYFGGKGWQA